MSVVPRYSNDILRHMYQRRWSIFILLALAFILSFFHRIAPAAIAEELRATFQINSALLGSLAATYFYVYTIMQIPTGVLVDTLGPRRILTVGGVIAGIGSILFGMAEAFELAAIGRSLVGLGVSVVFIAMLKITAEWFYERQFATVTGLMVALGNFGSISSAAPLAWLVESISWRSVFIATGLLSIVIAALIWLVVRDTPQQLNFPSIRELEGKPAHPPRKENWRKALMAVLKNRYTWPGFWVTLGCAGAFLSFAGLWGVPYFMNVYDMNRITAAYHTSLLLIGFASGSLMIGMLSDRFGNRRKFLISALSMYLLCWLVLVFFKLSSPLTYILCLVMGLTASGFTLCWTCAKEVNPPAVSGMATSVVNTGVFLGVGILQPLTGWAIDREGYESVITVLLLFVCFGWASTFFIKETYCKNIALHPEV